MNADKKKIVVIPGKIERAQLYISKELRSVLGWKSEEEITAIASDSILLLFRSQEFENIKKAIDWAIEKLNEIRGKI